MLDDFRMNHIPGRSTGCDVNNPASSDKKMPSPCCDGQMSRARDKGELAVGIPKHERNNESQEPSFPIELIPEALLTGTPLVPKILINAVSLASVQFVSSSLFVGPKKLHVCIATINGPTHVSVCGLPRDAGYL